MWEHRAKITGLMSQPITVRLLSPIMPPAQSIDSGTSHTQQVILFPTPLRQDALRGILEKFAKEQQTHGRPRFRLAQTIFGHDGPAFIIEDSYESVSELEAVSQQRVERASTLRAKTAAHLERPSIQRVREIIVPTDN